MLVGTDLLAIVGRSLAMDMSAQLPLTFRPFDFETNVAARGMVWSPVYDGDLAHKWLRTSVADEVERAIVRQWSPTIVPIGGERAAGR
jgi:hypothetical protein